MENLYLQFVRERQYLHSVSPKTLEAYHWAWKAFAPALSNKSEPCKADVVERIAQLRSAGLSNVTVNTYARSVNAFFRWLHTEGYVKTLVKVQRLKEETKVLTAFSDDQISKLIRYHPINRSEERSQMITALILDTGLRIEEALSLDLKNDIDLDQMLLTVRNGKGGKGRVNPFSIQLRKQLIRYSRKHVPEFDSLLFFAGRGERVQQRNALRDFKALCHKVAISGVRCSFHTIRHTFALGYIRNGGDVFRLQRLLGHSKLEMTRRYVNLQTEDLQVVHNRFSPLSRR